LPYPRFTVTIGLSSIIVGAVVALGWALESTTLKTLIPGQSTMKVNTGLCAIALGAALLLRRDDACGTAGVGGMLVLLVGGATLAEYISGRNLGHDELIFVDPNRLEAGRMGLNTAICLSLIGASLALLSRPGRRRTLLAHGCVFGALGLAFLALMGYVNGVEELYGADSYTAMALTTAILMVALCLAILASSAEYGLPATVLAPTPGGRMARRLLPVAGVPIVLYALRAWAQSTGWVSADVGIWIVATLLVAMLVVAVVFIARTVDRADASRELLAAVVESSSEAIITVTAANIVTTWNRGAEQLYGWSAREAVGEPISSLTMNGQPNDRGLIERAQAGDHVAGAETIRVHRDGTSIPIAATVWPLYGPGGVVTGVASISRDIGDRQRRLETQKLESLGALAGGIAHNFNNLLQGMLGNAELALSGLPADSPARSRIQQIALAGAGAAELAHDMLAYSGMATFIVEPVDLPRFIEETGRLVSAGSTAPIEIDYRFEEGLPTIDADPTQIRQVVMNLLSNAAEALGAEGGAITARAGVVDSVPESGFLFADEILPGPYVQLAIEDRGSGMDDETLAHLFDPFFTTKFTGRGLGLAAVLGIVRRHHGAIKVTSESGVGTTATVLLPCTAS
jgi:PAS domain S-box-containing protein